MASRKAHPSRMCLLWTRVLLRLIQFCSSLAAYVALQTACVTYQRITGGRKVAVVVSSGAVNFAMVINFLAFVYAFVFLVFVEWLRMCNEPLHFCEKVMNLIALICLTVATLVLLLSDISLHCRGSYGSFLHCGGLYLAIALMFLSTISFMCIVLLEWCAEDNGGRQPENREAQRQSEHGHAYSYHGTPRAGATPVPVVTAQPPHRAPPAST